MTPTLSIEEQHSGFSHSEKCSGVHIGAHCLIEDDLRGAIVSLTSRMLDNPDKNGIYPTSKFYDSLEEYIQRYGKAQREEGSKEEGLIWRTGVEQAFDEPEDIEWVLQHVGRERMRKEAARSSRE